MEEVRKQLTKREQALLADLWENADVMKALKKVLALHQLNLAQATLVAAPDFDFVLKNRGAVEEARWIVKFLLDNYKLNKPKED